MEHMGWNAIFEYFKTFCITKMCSNLPHVAFTPFYGIFAREISSTNILVDRDYYVIFYTKITNGN